MKTLPLILLAGGMFPNVEAPRRQDTGPALPILIFHLEGDDAVWDDAPDDTDLVSWPSEAGPDADLLPGCGVPQKSATLANGHVGVDFEPSTGDILKAGHVQDAVSDYTWEIVYSDEDLTSAARQYIGRSYGNGDGSGIDSTEDFAIAVRSNYVAGYAWLGYYNGTAGNDTSVNNGWHHFRMSNFRNAKNWVPAIANLHVDTWWFRSTADGGEARLYRDGVLVGVNYAWQPRKLSDLHIGGTPSLGTCTVPDTVGFDGTIYSMKIWNGPLSPADVVSSQEDAMERFGITAWPPAGYTTPESIFGSALIARFTTAHSFYIEYDENGSFRAWANFGNSNYVAIANLNNNIIFKAEDPDVGTFPSIKTSHGITTEAVLTAHWVAKSLYPAGAVTGAVTGIFVFHQCTGGGEGSNDGPIGAFGSSASNTPRIEFDYKSSATTRSLNIALSDASSNRNVQPTTDLGLVTHLVVYTQDESTDVATVQIDGGTVNTGSVVNNGTTTIDTYTVGARLGTTFTGGGAGCYRQIEHIIVQGLITTEQRTSVYNALKTLYPVIP